MRCLSIFHYTKLHQLRYKNHTNKIRVWLYALIHEIRPFFLKYCIYTGGVQEGRRRGTGRVQERYRKGTGRVNYDKTQDTRHKTQDTSEPRKRAISIKETPKPGEKQFNQTGIQDNISHELLKYLRQQNLSTSTDPVLRLMQSMDGLILLSYRP